MTGVGALDLRSTARRSWSTLSGIDIQRTAPGAKCTSLTSLSDFVSNLESSGYFKKSIEIVNSQTEALTQPPGELIKFTIKAVFQPPTENPNAPPGARRGG